MMDADDLKTSGIGGTALAVAAAVVGAGLSALVVRQLRRRSQHSFDDAAVVITGGSRGFGLALGRQLAAEGARLIIIARHVDELERAAEDLRACGAPEVLPIVCDVRDRQQVDEAVAQAVDAFGRIDVLINNAGVIHVAPFAHTPDEDFRESIDTHFWGALNCVRACLPSMLPHGNGRIVNISSVGGRVAVPHLAAYCAGKFALTGLSESLRMELAPHGLSVTTVTPFVMRTGSHRNAKVRGQHQREAIWFALGSSTPISSINADDAAAEVIEAARDRRAVVAPGWQSRTAELLHHIVPDAAAAAGGWLAEFVLPAETDDPEAARARRSRDLDLKLFARVFPTADAERFNQPVAADERRETDASVTSDNPEFARA